MTSSNYSSHIMSRISAKFLAVYVIFMQLVWLAGPVLSVDEPAVDITTPQTSADSMKIPDLDNVATTPSVPVVVDNVLPSPLPVEGSTTSSIVDVVSSTPLIIKTDEEVSAPKQLQSILLETAIKPLATFSEPSDSDFTVISPTLDRADLTDGHHAFRVYNTPRLTYVDNGILKVRASGWNWFDKTPESHLAANESAYTYNVPTQAGDNIAVAVGTMDIGDAHTFTPSHGEFSQAIDNGATITNYKQAYPGVDIQFRDAKWQRSKKIVIKNIPDGLTVSDTVTFWETYSLPSKATVVDENNKEILDGQVIKNLNIAIRTKDHERFTISPAIIFDSAANVDEIIKQEFYSQAVDEVISLDQKNNVLKVGLRVPGSYLMNSARVFPVTIDPTYYLCSEDQSNARYCALTDFYIRALNGNADTTGGLTSSVSSEALFLGRYNNGSIYTRHPVLYFTGVNFGTFLANQTIDLAHVRMYYRNIGLPSPGGDTTITTVARSINRGDSVWPTTAPGTGLTYNDLRSYLVSGNSPMTINNVNAYGSWYDWDVANSVTRWVNMEFNSGVLFEGPSAWSSGTTPPSDWNNRLIVLDSSRAAASTSPYLYIVTHNTAGPMPDLTSYYSDTYTGVTSVQVGDTITGSFHIQNQGNATAPAGQVTVYFGSYVGDRSTAVQTINYGTIAAGAMTTVSFQFTVPDGTGSRYINWFMDSGNSATESDETNNTSYYGDRITVSNATSAADPFEPNDTSGQAYNLGTITSFVNNNLLFTAGDQDWFRFSYNNQTYYFKVQGYGSGVTGNYGIQLSIINGQLTIETVSVSGSSVDTVLYLYDNNLNQLANNDDFSASLFSQIVYTLPGANPSIDLSVANAQISGLQIYHPGNTITVFATVANSSATDVTDVGYQIVLIDTASGATFNLQSQTPTAIDRVSYSSDQLYFSGVIPASIPTYRNYYIRMIVDPGAVVNDPNRNNNTANDNPSIHSFSIQPQDYSGGGGSSGGGSSASQAAQIVHAGTPSPAQSNTNISHPNPGVNNSIQPDAGNGVGDPINPRTGAFEFTENDLELPGRGAELNFTRVYNSKNQERIGRFGRGWDFSFNQYLYYDSASSSVNVYEGSSVVGRFTSTDSGVTFTALPGDTDTLTKVGDNFALKKLNGTSYQFITVGTTDGFRILSNITDSNGNATTLTYMTRLGVPLLSTLTDAAGRAYNFTYGAEISDQWDKIIRIEDANTSIATYRTLDYGYDIDLNLIGVTTTVRTTAGSVQTAEQFIPDVNKRMGQYIDARGTILYNTYDTDGRTTKQEEYNPLRDTTGTKRTLYDLIYTGTDATIPNSISCTEITNYLATNNGYTEKMCWNANNLRISNVLGGTRQQDILYNTDGMTERVTDGNGNVTRYEYDTHRRKTKVVQPDTAIYHTETTYTYNTDFAKPSSVCDHTYRLDNPTQVTDRCSTYVVNAQNGNIESVTDYLGHAETYTYDNYGNIFTHADKRGNVTTYTYDATNNYPTTITQTVHKPDNTVQVLTTTYTYDTFGRKISECLPGIQCTTFTYDSAGRLQSKEISSAYIITYSYDSEGHLIAEHESTGGETQYTYDKNIYANLTETKVVGRNGTPDIATHKEYYDEGKLKAEIDALGHRTEYTYDTRGNVATKTTPTTAAAGQAGAMTAYTYDVNNNLTETLTTAPDIASVRTTYIYDERNNLIEIRKYLNTTQYISTRTEYDGFGRKIRTIDGRGNVTQFGYDNNNRLTTTTNALGNVISYSYDFNGNKTCEISPNAQTNTALRNANGCSTSYTYDEANRLIKTTNANNKDTVTTYTEAGKVQSIVDRQNANVTNNTHVTSYVYDTLGNLTLTTFANGSTAGSTYDAKNRVVAGTDQFGHITTYTYDDLNRVLTQTDPAGNTTSYTYDAVGNKTSVTYPGGKVVMYTYDVGNRLQKMSENAAAMADPSAVSLGNNRWYVEKIVSNYVTDAATGTLGWSFFSPGLPHAYAGTYDIVGNFKTVYLKSNQFGFHIPSTAQINGVELILEKSLSPGHSTPPTDSEIKLVNNGVIGTENKSVPDDWIFSFEHREWETSNYGHYGGSSDSWGQHLTPDNINDPLFGFAVSVNVARTPNDFVDEVRNEAWIADTHARIYYTLPMGQEKTYTYNSLGNKLSETDGRGNATAYTYDALNRLTSETNATGTVTTYTYDENNNRLTESTAGKVRTWVYDALNRESTFTDRGKQVEHFTYDANSNVATKLDGNNHTTTYTYDALNRATTKNIPLLVGEGLGGVSTIYNYDNWNNVTNITEGTTTTFSAVYDVQNHPTTETRRIPALNRGTTALTIQRTYRPDGSLASITDASGKTISYNYDSRNLLDTVTYNGTILADYAYNAVGKPTDLIYSNGVHTTYAYDIFNRLQTMQVVSATGTLFARQDYTYDSTGNRTSLTEDNDRTINYTYDNIDQLIGVDYSNIPGTNDVQYTYDMWGNRTNLVNPIETVGYTYANNSNELTSLSHNNGALTTNMTYDGNGALTSEQYTRLGTNTRRTDYSWDLQGRLSGVTYTNQSDTLTTNVLGFVYSDDGNRVGKSVNGVWSYTLNDGLNLLDDLSANGTIQKTYIRGIDAIAEITASGTIQFVHTDALGSTILLTDNSGNIAARYEYDAFGNIVGASTQGADTNSLYTGQEFDPESELVYMNARYYNPELGRFISRDGVLGSDGDLLSKNGYIYVKNNPLKYTDPSGNLEEFLRGLKQSFDQWEIEVGMGAEIYYQESPFWKFVMDHPYVSGPAVGVISGLSAAGAVIATGGTFVCGILCGPAAAAVGGAAGTLGSTGRIAPETLQEQLAMSEVVSNPGIGQPIISSLSDPRWLGWAKMEYIKRLADGTNIVIHYVAQIINNNIVAIDDFKFK